MSLAVKVINVPAAILQPICTLARTGSVEHGGATISCPERRMTITIGEGKLQFSPPLKLTYKAITVSVSEARVETKNGEQSLLFDIKLSPIDIELRND